MSTLLCVRSIARPYIVELSKNTNETVCLSGWEADKIVVLERASGVGSLAVDATIGIGGNPTHSSIGKLLLSHVEEGKLPEELHRFLAEKGADAENHSLPLLQEIARIRRHDHCCARNDVQEGVSTLSHLVETCAGNFVTSILVATERLEEVRKEFASKLQKAARSLEIDLLAHLSE